MATKSTRPTARRTPRSASQTANKLAPGNPPINPATSEPDPICFRVYTKMPKSKRAMRRLIRAKLVFHDGLAYLGFVKASDTSSALEAVKAREKWTGLPVVIKEAN